MSLDVSLETRNSTCECCRGTGTVDRKEVFDGNITHNLGAMAMAAGIYQVMWHPEEVGVTKASQALPILKDGLQWLLDNPAEAKKHDPPNKWGDYDGLVEFVRTYIDACRVHPDAEVSVSR